MAGSYRVPLADPTADDGTDRVVRHKVGCAIRMMPKIMMPMSRSWRPLAALRTNCFQAAPDGAARAHRGAQSERATPAEPREAFDR
jgi:hypothetical protein